MEFTGNQRLLYIEQKISELDIAAALGKIDLLVIDSSKLEFDSSDIVLEFRDNPRTDNFSDGLVLVGRLITGFEQSVFDELGYRDYSEDSKHSHTVAPYKQWSELFSSLALLIPKEIQAWKLKIDDAASKITVQF